MYLQYEPSMLDLQSFIHTVKELVVVFLYDCPSCTMSGSILDSRFPSSKDVTEKRKSLTIYLVSCLLSLVKVLTALERDLGIAEVPGFSDEAGTYVIPDGTCFLRVSLGTLAQDSL